MQQRPRQSRRSACNRCRTYKLRCERTPVDGDSCQRCFRTGVLCATTNERYDARSSAKQAQQTSSPTDVFGGREADGAALQPGTHQGDPGRRENFGGGSQPAMDLGLGTPMRPSSIDFGFTNFSFPSEHHGGQQSASPTPLDHTHQGQESLAGIPALNHPSGVSTSRDSAIALTRVTTPSTGSLAAAPSFPNPVRDLHELCYKLAEDQDVLDTGNISTPGSPGSEDIMETAAQRALRRTTSLSEILKSMAAREQIQTRCASQRYHSSPTSREPPSSAGSFAYIGMGSGADPSPTTLRRKRTQPDPVLVTAVSTAYILLIRTWRDIFLQLHRLLVLATTDLPSSSDRFRLPMLLPSLQLGGFTVQNNPTIQVVVLLELVSSMLSVVEGRLGIAEQWPRNQAVDRHPHHQHQQQTDEAVMVLKPFTDPVAISIRETLLSQEVLRIAAAEDDECGLAQLSLRELMDEIKKQV